MKKEDRNKTGFLGPNGQWVYNRMCMGLKGLAHTYAQFSDIVFRPLPGNSKGGPRMPTLIGPRENTFFGVHR